MQTFTDHYGLLLYRAHDRLEDWDAAKDAVQDVALKALRRKGGVVRNPLTYLKVAVRNKCKEIRRNAARWRLLRIPMPEDDVAAMVEMRLELLRIDRALRGKDRMLLGKAMQDDHEPLSPAERVALHRLRHRLREGGK